MILLGLLLALPLHASSPYARSPLADDDGAVDTLFQQLQLAESYQQALKLEFEILDIWTKSSPNERARELMWLGIISFEQKEFDNARLMFDGVIREDPAWAEGWNKRATIHFFQGNFEASRRDIAETLSREPRHFGSLAGLGHINAIEGKDTAALIAFRKALNIHPFMRDVLRHLEVVKNRLQTSRPET